MNILMRKGGFGYSSLVSDPLDLAKWSQRILLLIFDFLFYINVYVFISSFRNARRTLMSKFFSTQQLFLPQVQKIYTFNANGRCFMVTTFS